MCRQAYSKLESSVNEEVIDMTYYQAALKILRSSDRPLTSREITDEALRRKLITPRGKTPHATMAAELYVHAHKDPELVKLDDRGEKQAKSGSVRWTVRRS